MSKLMTKQVLGGKFIHLYNLTDTNLTSVKYVVDVFPTDFTTESGEDSKPRPSHPIPTN